MLPVWGAAFVQRFLDCSLPSLLAAGNIPALAQALPTRFVLLTRSTDIPAITNHPSWHHLARICKTEVQSLDELIVHGNHHATVTLAYARIIRATGCDLRDTVFVFLVGDYLVAERSLRTVLQRIQSGTSAVLAGNLQVPVDVAVPFSQTCPRTLENGLLLSHRPLVKWALAHLHPTCAASVVNTSFLHQSEANRLFWATDKDTLIGRFYLLHMIAIRPEVSDFVADGPCDYAFVPELCPSRNVDVLVDSDDYFVVEMQPRHQGLETLQWGPARTSQLALELSQWTTAEHRQNSTRTLIFHAGEIPEEITESIAMASAFVEDIAKAMSPHPQSHRNHPVWIGMMALQRAGGGLSPGDEGWAPLFGTTDPNGKRGGLLWKLRLGMLGYPPDVTPFHPRWPDFRVPRSLLKSRLSGSGRLLLISDAPRAVERWLAPLGATILSLDADEIPNLSDEGLSRIAGPFDACLWIIDEGTFATSQSTLDLIRGSLRPGGSLVIFTAEDIGSAHASTHARCASIGFSLRQSGFRLEDTRYVPVGPIRVALHQGLVRLMRASRRNSLILRLPAVVASAFSMAAILVCNLIVRSRSSSRPPQGNCSSVVLAARSPSSP